MWPGSIYQHSYPNWRSVFLVTEAGKNIQRKWFINICPHIDRTFFIKEAQIILRHYVTNLQWSTGRKSRISPLYLAGKQGHKSRKKLIQTYTEPQCVGSWLLTPQNPNTLSVLTFKDGDFLVTLSHCRFPLNQHLWGHLGGWVGWASDSWFQLRSWSQGHPTLGAESAWDSLSLCLPLPLSPTHALSL